MQYDIWLVPSNATSPYTQPTYLGRYYGATVLAALTDAAAQTGNSINNLQATPVFTSSF